jgi:phage baseplate assembly protein V
MMIARSVIKTINDSASIQQVCIGLLAGEMRDKVERFQNYGFSSVPLVGMEAVTAFIAGDRSNGIIVAVGDRKFRVRGLKSGEVCIYTDEGDTIKLARGHNIVATTETFTNNVKKYIINASESVEINTPQTNISNNTSIGGNTDVTGTTAVGGNISGGGNITGSGEITDAKGSMSGIRGIFNSHTHPETDSTTGSPNQTMPS